MSPEDPLAAAVRALRDTPEAPEALVAATERRALATLAAQPSSPPRRRRPLVTAAVALALTLVGTTSLALARAGLIEVPRWLGEVIGAPDGQAPRAVPRAVPPSVAPPPESKPEPAGALEEALEAAPPPPRAPAVARPDAPARSATKKRQTHPVEPRPVEARAEPTSTPPSVNAAEGEQAPMPPPVVLGAPSPGSPSARATPASTSPDALYADGHRAHFVEKNPQAALEAWDQYLAVAPHGRFAPEARFNRAIDLVRLGRTGEAADALEALAHGDYRPADAARLLEALQRGTVRGE
jgi:hypothetical protein